METQVSDRWQRSLSTYSSGRKRTTSNWKRWIWVSWRACALSMITRASARVGCWRKSRWRTWRHSRSRASRATNGWTRRKVTDWSAETWLHCLAERFGRTSILLISQPRSQALSSRRWKSLGTLLLISGPRKATGLGPVLQSFIKMIQD